MPPKSTFFSKYKPSPQKLARAEEARRTLEEVIPALARADETKRIENGIKGAGLIVDPPVSNFKGAGVVLGSGSDSGPEPESGAGDGSGVGESTIASALFSSSAEPSPNSMVSTIPEPSTSATGPFSSSLEMSSTTMDSKVASSSDAAKDDAVKDDTAGDDTERMDTAEDDTTKDDTAKDDKTAITDHNPRIRIRVVAADIINAAARLHRERQAPNESESHSTSATDSTETKDTGKEKANEQKSRNIAILNAASVKQPGGGWLSGSTAMEEDICMCTTLYPSLRREFYPLPELGSVWTSDVLVIRQAEPLTRGVFHALPPEKRWFVDVVSAAMLKNPKVDKGPDGEAKYSNPADRATAEKKMRAVLRIFASKGCNTIVLCAWGAGAYHNPLGEIARLWRKVLADADYEGFQFKEVVFAIKDPNGNVAASFAKELGLDSPVEDWETGADHTGGGMETSKEETAPSV